MIRLQHRLEYGALIAVKKLVNLLPYRAALALGWLLALAGFHLVRFRRAEAIRRIRSVFGDTMTARRAEAVAWEAFRNFLFTAVESMRGERIDAAWVNTHVRGHALFEFMKAHTGTGAIMALPHMGSWELAGAAAHALGIPFFTIGAKQKNPLFNDYLNRQRAGSGIDILVRGDVSLKGVIRRLKEGKCFAILPDVRNPTPALSVPFLGSTANVAAGMALFARQAGVPIVAVILTRQGWTRHTFTLLEPIRPDPALDRDEDLLRMTRTIFAQFDAAIRENPGQWFWYNKRWILDPVTPAPLQPPI
ncbi:MAG: lysophospholipid acyltransferase family protein [Kiritimatiellia bacterium]